MKILIDWNTTSYTKHTSTHQHINTQHTSHIIMHSKSGQRFVSYILCIPTYCIREHRCRPILYYTVKDGWWLKDDAFEVTGRYENHESLKHQEVDVFSTAFSKELCYHHSSAKHFTFQLYFHSAGDNQLWLHCQVLQECVIFNKHCLSNWVFTVYCFCKATVCVAHKLRKLLLYPKTKKPWKWHRHVLLFISSMSHIPAFVLRTSSQKKHWKMGPKYVSCLSAMQTKDGGLDVLGGL